MKKEFTHLHNHTEYSLLDGCGKIGDFVAKAHELGQSHFAVTEHGSMRSFYKLTIACKKHGKVKPIYGIEFYMSEDMNVKSLPDELKAKIQAEYPKGKQRKIMNEWERKLAIRPRFHLCAFAKNNEGLRNLFRLSSLGWTKGFYYRPRIDKEALLAHRGDFIVTSACIAGVIPQLLLEGKFKEAVKEAEWWKANFGDDFYLEIMPHTFPDQLKLTPMIVKLAKALDIKLIATNDCHYINSNNAIHQQILLCIQTNDKMHNPKRFKFDTDEFWMKTYDEMCEGFGDHHEIDDKDFKEALSNTAEIVEKCQVDVVLDKFKCLLPPISVPDSINKRSASDVEAQSKYLQQLCMEGWDWRDLDDQISLKAAKLGVLEPDHVSTYADRLKLELAAIKRQKFSGYFIIVHELFKWCRQEGIMVGPGRGSSAGSLVCYLLGITSLDPIEHGLLFERFLNPARIDMPDIDMDFEDQKRERVIQYLRNKYGLENCAQIGTVIQMKGKLCLRDVCRVMGIPSSEVGAVTNSIIERSSGDERASQTILDSFKEFDVCKAFDERHPDILPIVQQLEGQVRQTGMHAAGVLTSPVPIMDVIPIETRELIKGGKRVPVAAIDFWGCEDMGLLKLDILGLRTLSVIRDALDIIEDRHGAKIDLERLGMDDPKVLKNFTERNFAGVFQFDTTAMHSSCENIVFTDFADIGAMCALNRPGTMRSGLAGQYVERKNDPAKRKSIHPIYDKICEETQGVLVYQEQLTRIFIEMAGYEPATADSLRKLVAKKHGDEAMGKEREKFVKGATERGVSPELADKLMSQITFFGCLPGSTMIAMASDLCEKPLRRSIKKLYELQERENVNCQNNLYHCGHRRWNRKVFSVDFKTGALIKNTIKIVIYSGKRHLYELLVYQDNKAMRKIKASRDHHFYVKNCGWTKLKDLLVGDKIAVRYFPEVAAVKRAEQLQDGASGTYMRKLGEKHYNLRCAICGWDHWIHFHHIDKNDRNNVVENLVPLCPNHHKMVHLGILKITDEQRCAVLKTESEINSVSHYHYQFVREIKFVGMEDTYDLELEQEPRNYMANNFITHNSYAFNKSHSYAYGTISYWCMYLKTYYPVEWMWAVLKNTPQRQEVTRFIKATKTMGIDVLGPDVNKSGVTFKIVGDQIKCSLLDIKGVGEKAIQAIINSQPYKSISDMLQRADRRLVKRNVIMALAKAGAMDSILPNAKYFIENIESLYKFVAKEKWSDLETDLEKSKSEPDFTDGEKALLAVEVSPLPMGVHPIEAFNDTLKQLGKHVKLATMDDPDLFDKHLAYFAGQIVDIRYNQIGDFHSGTELDDHSKKKMKWGARYSNFNVEDVTGIWQRVKLDVDSFPIFRHIIDSGIGTMVLFRAQLYTRGNWKTIKAYNLIDLSEMNKKLVAGESLTYWEQYFIKHPVLDLLDGRKAMQFGKQRGKWLVVGLIVAARHTIDKNENDMCFFDVDCGKLIHRVVCFHSAYDKFKDKLKVGIVGVFEFTKSNTGFILDDSGSIDVVKSHSWKKAK